MYYELIKNRILKSCISHINRGGNYEYTRNIG